MKCLSEIIYYSVNEFINGLVSYLEQADCFDYDNEEKS